MLDLEKKKRQEINNMVAILEQIDLPDIILLTRHSVFYTRTEPSRRNWSAIVTVCA